MANARHLASLHAKHLAVLLISNVKITTSKNDFYDFLTKKLSFPCEERKLTEALQELHLGEAASTGIYISKVEHPEEFKFFENQIVNLDELNYLAKRLESFFSENEFSQFFEAMKHEGFTEMKDIINLTFNLHRYPLIQDISNATKIGREYVAGKQFLSEYVGLG